MFGVAALAWLSVFTAMSLDDRASGSAVEASADASVARLAAEAAHDGSTEVASLVQDGADANAVLPDGATALHWAVYESDAEAAANLLARGADPKLVTREGMTPLSLAAINGDAAMIGRLLDAGADVNERLEKGETPLMFAARTGSADAVELLIARGADVN